MKRYQKILLGVLAGIVLLVAGIQLYVSLFLDERLKEQAVSQFHAATNDAYHLDIEDIDLSLWGRRIEASELSVSSRKEKDSELEVSLDELNVSGIAVWKLLMAKQVDLREIELINPDIAITATQNGSGSKPEPQNFSAELSKKILDELQSVSVRRLWVSGLSLTYNQADTATTPLFSFHNSSIQLHNIRIDSASATEDKILPLDGITTNIHDLRYRTSDELYELSVDRLYLSSRDAQLNIDSLQLAPTLQKGAFARKKGHEVDRLALTIQQITGEKIDFEKVNRAKGLAVQKISLNKPDLSVYRDKRAPDAPPKKPPLPQEAVQDIPFALSIDTVAIAGGNIRYAERHPEGEKEGFIEFANLTASLTHWTNNKEQWAEHPPHLTAETEVMGRGRLQTDFTFLMDPNEQQIKGSLRSMEAQTLNPALEPMAFVRADDGTILGLDFNMHLGEHIATGETILRYEDLKISLLNKELNEETLGKEFMSLLANTFKVKSSNTGDDIRTGEVDYERDKQKSVFNYWWKSLLSGLKSSIGL